MTLPLTQSPVICRMLSCWALWTFVLGSVNGLPLQAADTPLKSDQLGATNNVHTCGNVYLCGQPSAADLKLAKSKGIKTVLSLRTNGEIDWDEAAAAQQLGLKFECVPFRGPETLTDEVFDKTRDILKQSAKAQEGVIVHCGSANRVGAIWLVHRVLDDHIPLAAAQQEAKQVGLRTAEYETRAIEYIQAHSN